MNIVARGKSVTPGCISGTARIVKKVADIERVENGDIMVVKYSNPAFALGVMKSAGLICEIGGALTHICIISMEMGIPCIAGAKHITELLCDGMLITLNSTEGLVYSDGSKSN